LIDGLSFEGVEEVEDDVISTKSGELPNGKTGVK